MIPLGLTVAQRREFEKALCDTHELRVRLRLQTLDGDSIADVSDRLVDGQVNIDTTAETTRQCSLTLDDPHHALDLDSDAPADGAIFADRMLRVDYRVRVDALGEWVSVPIFSGPVATMTRNGGQVELSCLGKEHLAGGNLWRPMTLRKGMNTVDAIKALLRDRAGEDRFAFPALNKRLPRTMSLGRMAVPWVAAQQLARSLNRQLYYDGEGVCRLRKIPHGAIFTFRDGTGGSVLSDPSIAFDAGTLANVVWVKGGKPRGSKHAVHVSVVAPKAHPVSPWRLGRNGKPRFIVTEVSNDALRSRRDARQIARRILSNGLRESVTASFDALPVPHLDPLDVVRLATDDVSLTFVLRQASIPLLHSGTMSVGALRRVTPSRKRIR